ncbi:MAG: AAA family ATPase [Proteobacteria bacterium]|nr:AAA family ATPase [Pseudomonadota bacterium]
MIYFLRIKKHRITELQDKTYTINIGVDDFKKMATSNTLFVDKTSFIYALLGSEYHVTLITRPRRWGKTLNMTMLQYFFGIPVKNNGDINEEEFSKKQAVFSKLKIGEHLNIIENYLGKFPVIFVSFKEIKGNEFEMTQMKIKELIYGLYETHKYLLQSDKLDDIQKTLFKKFITKSFDLAELEKSLFYLSKMLSTHFDQKVFILIDEYDTPLNDWYAVQLAQEGISVTKDKYFQSVLSLFRGILSSALKGMNILKKVL